MDWQDVGRFIGKAAGIVLIILSAIMIFILAGYICHGAQYFFQRGWSLWH